MSAIMKPFGFFMKHPQTMPMIVAAYPGVVPGTSEFSDAGRELWEHLSAEEKQPFIDQSKAQRSSSTGRTTVTNQTTSQSASPSPTSSSPSAFPSPFPSSSPSQTSASAMLEKEAVTVKQKDGAEKENKVDEAKNSGGGSHGKGFVFSSSPSSSMPSPSAPPSPPSPSSLPSDKNHNQWAVILGRPLPQRPQTAWLLFLSHMNHTLNLADSFGEFRAANMWRELPEEGRKRFEQQAQTEQERYEREMAEFVRAIQEYKRVHGLSTDIDNLHLNQRHEDGDGMDVE